MSTFIFGSLALWVLVQQTSSLEDCMVQTLNGAITTKPGLSLKGHVKKKLQTTSFLQCGMRCLQNDWCASINFEVSKLSGICELNNHGVGENGDLLENFEERKGFVYSQLRSLEFICRENFCSNGGTCTLNCQTSRAQCLCPEGFRGATCQDINECSSNPCQNGGTCTDDQVNGYSCTCAAGYSGTRCELVFNINECSSNPCLYGGTCTDHVNSYSCTCAAGYSGISCENNINECSSNPCQNGGTCTDQVNGYSCACVAGYSGTNCENSVNACLSSPCVKGDCIDIVNDYNCRCPEDYSGKNCQYYDD